MILLVVDAHLKWMEAFPVTTASSATTIERLWHVFRLPETVVSDKAAISQVRNLELNAICHIKLSQYHPSSNGLVE